MPWIPWLLVPPPGPDAPVIPHPRAVLHPPPPCVAILCNMTRAEYERHKQRLDEELRAGMEMLAAAHRYQLRALEMVWAVMGGEGAAIPPPVVAPAIPELDAALPPPSPPKPRRHKAGELFEAVRTALDQLP